MRKLLPLAGLIVALVGIHGLGIARRVMQSAASRTFESGPLMWFYAAYNLLFAAAMLGLAWLVCGWQPRSKLVAAIYLSVGVLLVLSAPARMLPLRNIVPPLAWLLNTSGFAQDPATGPVLAGAFIALSGLIALLPRRRTDLSPRQAESHPQG